MKKLLLILFTLLTVWCSAQTTNANADRLRQKDSIARARRADSIAAVKAVVARRLKDSLHRVALVHDSLRAVDLAHFSRRVDSGIYNHHPFFRFSHPLRLITVNRTWQGKESIFYCIVGLLLFFAVTKNAFSRYLGDLYKIFFRTTLKLRQTRDQLITAPLPSLLFNTLFVLSGGLFICLVIRHFQPVLPYSLWTLFAYCISGIIIIYCIKFMALKLLGWLLKISEATNIYIFIVFTTNKVLGIVLLPFVISLAFMTGIFYQMALSLSLAVVVLFFIYRYYLSYVSVHKLIKINLLHFFIYLCAFEVVPLLLISKLLFTFFRNLN